MSTKTKVKIRTTKVRMIAKDSDQITTHNSDHDLTIPQAKEIAKAQGLTYLDKSDHIITAYIENSKLLSLIED